MLADSQQRVRQTKAFPSRRVRTSGQHPLEQMPGGDDKVIRSEWIHGICVHARVIRLEFPEEIRGAL